MTIDPRFLFRPDVFFRGISRKFKTRPMESVVKTSWGDALYVWPQRHIGGHIYMRGCHEIHVCEALCRLADIGETVIDVGGNIGQMTCLLAGLVGNAGHVHSFEAHPDIFRVLESNVKLNNFANVSVFNLAATSEEQVLQLSTGDELPMNEGITTVSAFSNRNTDFTLTVSGVTLDSRFPDGEIGLLKIDVEGHEVEVLLGASSLLFAKRVRDIAYEWRDGGFDGPHVLLREYGYHVFALSQHWSGPVISPYLISPEDDSSPMDFIATLDPDRLLMRLRPRGWKCLKYRQSHSG